MTLTARIVTPSVILASLACNGFSAIDVGSSVVENIVVGATGGVGRELYDTVVEPKFDVTLKKIYGRDTNTNKAFQAQDYPFVINIDTFSEDILTGYDQCAYLKDDVEEAARFYMNKIIVDNAKADTTYCDLIFHRTSFDGEPPVLAAPEDGDTSSAGSSGTRETDFSTNNQEDNVDEADIVKSDGDLVYAAYGDMLIVWKSGTGEEVTRIKMPERLGDVEEEAEDNGEVIVERLPFFLNPRPRIRSLLLDVDAKRLVVIVEGYGRMIRYYQPSNRIFPEYGSTHVRVYDTSSGGKLSLLGTREMQGNYQSARSIGHSAHIVTISNINTYFHLSKPLQRCEPDYVDMDNEQYTAAATAKAEEILPKFVDQFLSELETKNDCTNIAKLSLFQDEESGEGGEYFTYSNGILNGFAQVSSFSMNENFETDVPISMAVGGSFIPNSYAQVYSSSQMMVLAVQGYSFLSSSGSYKQCTYLVGFHLEEGAARPAAVGSIPGYVLNQFSMSEYDGHLRVATTTNAQWGRVEEINAEGRVSIVWRRITEVKNQVIVLEIPDIFNDDGDEEMTTKKTGVFTEVGRVDDIGKKGETIFAVRFLKSLGFVVTFERIDPFYILDLSTPSNPQAVGELEISGFSNYLHPIGDDYVLAVGQEADPEGFALGLAISLFDVRDVEMPKLLQKYVVEQDEKASSSSQAQYEHKAFRYLEKSKLLIIPASIYRFGFDDGNFDGFYVFDVDKDEIAPRFNISHVESADLWRGCWYNAYMPARSLVFDGKITTMKGHSVLSHDLDTEEELWKLDLDEDVEDDCFPYILF